MRTGDLSNDLQVKYPNAFNSDTKVSSDADKEVDLHNEIVGRVGEFSKQIEEQQKTKPQSRNWGELFKSTTRSFKKGAGGILTACTLPSTIFVGVLGGTIGGLIGLGSAMRESLRKPESSGTEGLNPEDKQSFFEKHGENINSTMSKMAVQGLVLGSGFGLREVAGKDTLKEWTHGIEKKLPGYKEGIDQADHWGSIDPDKLNHPSP